MKKIIMIMVCILMYGVQLTAYDFMKNLEVGIEAGPALGWFHSDANLDGNGTNKPLVTYTADLFCNYKLSSKFFTDFSFGLDQSVGKYQNEHNDYDIDGNLIGLLKTYWSFRQNYLFGSSNFNYRLFPFLSIGCGATLSIPFDNLKMKVKDDEINENLTIEKKRLNQSLNSLSFQLRYEKENYSVKLKYNYGLNNFFKEDDFFHEMFGFKPRTIQLIFGYRIK